MPDWSRFCCCHMFGVTLNLLSLGVKNTTQEALEIS